MFLCSPEYNTVLFDDFLSTIFQAFRFYGLFSWEFNVKMPTKMGAWLLHALITGV